MPCYHPVEAYRGRKDEDGIRPVVWRRSESDSSLVDVRLSLPCGKCIGCKLLYSQMWALRCMHEASLYVDNCFLTLTYSDASLPPKGSLVKADFQGFIKRLRARFPGRVIRYFHCGEYGDDKQRPHYHCLLFGFNFPDRVLWQLRGEHQCYRSEILEELWPFGLSEIGALTMESAQYVARYAVKKLTDVSSLDGRIPEYVTMSRRPGIGRPWYDRFKSDAYPSDFLISGTSKVSVPRYYDGILRDEDPDLYARLKARRSSRGRKSSVDNDAFRLSVKEQCKLAQIKSLKRNLED